MWQHISFWGYLTTTIFHERPQKSFVTLHQESLDTLTARGFDKECIAFTLASGGAMASGGATATGGATASSGAIL